MSVDRDAFEQRIGAAIEARGRGFDDMVPLSIDEANSLLAELEAAEAERSRLDRQLETEEEHYAELRFDRDRLAAALEEIVDKSTSGWPRQVARRALEGTSE